MNRAVVLLSGGLDSTTTLAIARDQAFECYALSFDYGQRHRIELEAARRVANVLGALEHRVAQIDLRVLGGSALTADIGVPKNALSDAIPITYVPARNTIFLSYALAWAELLGARDIFIGVNAIDYSGYPDCRPEFLSAFEKLASVATKAGVEGKAIRIRAPLVTMSKADIVREATRRGIDLSLTHSCYDPRADGTACGECDSCLLRRKGFSDAGVTDPLRYATP